MASNPLDGPASAGVTAGTAEPGASPLAETASPGLDWSTDVPSPSMPERWSKSSAAHPTPTSPSQPDLPPHPGAERALEAQALSHIDRSPPQTPLQALAHAHAHAQSPSQDESNELSPSLMMDSDAASDAGLWQSTLLAPSDFASSELGSPAISNHTADLAASPGLASRDGVSTAVPETEGVSPFPTERMSFIAAAAAAPGTGSPAGLNSLLTTPLSRGSSLLSPLTPPDHRTPFSHEVVRALPFPSLVSPPAPAPPSDAQLQLMGTRTQPGGLEGWPDFTENVEPHEMSAAQGGVANSVAPRNRVGQGILEAGSRLREQAESAEGVPGYLEAVMESRASSEGSTGSVCAGTGPVAGGGSASSGALAATATPSATAGAASASRQSSGSSIEGGGNRRGAEERAQQEGDFMVSVAKRRAFFEQGSGQGHARGDTPEGWRFDRPPGRPTGSQGSGNSHRSTTSNGSNASSNNKIADSSRSQNSSDGQGNGGLARETDDEGERHANGGPLLSSQGGYYEEESESSSSSCCTSRLRTEDGVLVGEEDAPEAHITEEEDAPGAHITEEEDTPEGHVTEEEEAPGARVTEEEDVPGVRVTEEEDAPGAHVTEEEEAPGARVTMGEWHVAEHGGQVAEEAAGKPGATGVGEWAEQEEVPGTQVMEEGLAESQVAERGGVSESQVTEVGAPGVGEAVTAPLPSSWGVDEQGVDESVSEEVGQGTMVSAEGLPGAAVTDERLDESQVTGASGQVAPELLAEQGSSESQEGSHRSQVTQGGGLGAARLAESVLVAELASNEEGAGPGALWPADVTPAKSQVPEGRVAVGEELGATGQTGGLGVAKEGRQPQFAEEPLDVEEGAGSSGDGLSALVNLMRDSASTWDTSEPPSLVESGSAEMEHKVHVETPGAPSLLPAPEDSEVPADVVPTWPGQCPESREGSPVSHSGLPEGPVTVTVAALKARSHCASLLHTFADGAGVVRLDKDSGAALRGAAALIPVVTRDCRVCSEVTVQPKVEHEPGDARQDACGVPLVSRCTNTISNCSSRYRQCTAAQGRSCKAPRKAAWSHRATTTTPAVSTLATNGSRSTAGGTAEGVASCVGGSVQLAHHWPACGVPVVDREGTLHCDPLGTLQNPPVYPGLAFGEWRASEAPTSEPDPAAMAPEHPGSASGPQQAAQAASMDAGAAAHGSEDLVEATGVPMPSAELGPAEPFSSLLQPGTAYGAPQRDMAGEEAWGLGLSLGLPVHCTPAAGEQSEGRELSAQGVPGEDRGPQPAAHAPSVSHGIESPTCDSPLGLSLDLRLGLPGSATPPVHRATEPCEEPGAGVAPVGGPGGGGVEAAGAWAAAHGSAPNSAVVVEIDPPPFQAGEPHAGGAPGVYQASKGVGRYQVPPSEWGAVFPPSLATPAAKVSQDGGIPTSPRSLFLKLQSPEPGGPEDEEEHTEQYDKECRGAADKGHDGAGGANGGREGGFEAEGQRTNGEWGRGEGLGEGPVQEEEDEDEDTLWALLRAFQVTRHVESTAAFGLVARVAPQLGDVLTKATEAALVGVLASFTSVLVAALVNSATQDVGFLPS